MSERPIYISPYNQADDLIELSASVFIKDTSMTFEVPNNKNLVLYNYSLDSGEQLIPRNYEEIVVIVKPKLEKKSYDDIKHLILEGELTSDTVKLRLQITCKKTRWCSNQTAIPLNQVDGKKEWSFRVPMSDVKEEIILSGYITRENSNPKIESRKANNALSILSTSESVQIILDERKEIGGNHLPIEPEDMRELLFDIHGMDNSLDLPRIKYAAELHEYFVRDNLKTIQVTFMMMMFYFLDSYLKWLVFICQYDEHDKNQKSLVETLAKYCDISKSNLIELITEKKHSEKQSVEYFKLSKNLFKNFQKNSSFKYLKELKHLIKLEIKNEIDQ